MTNAEIRTQLRELLQAFVDQNCQYDGSENKACLELLSRLYPVDTACEEYNKANPLHGKPIHHG